MSLPVILDFVAKASYFAAALLFIIGLMQMGSPVTAKRGIRWAGFGMVIATLVTFVAPSTWGSHGIDPLNFGLMAVAIVLSFVFWLWGKRVPITDMPQMVAIFNGMGGGSAAAIGAYALINAAGHTGTCTPADMAAHACLDSTKLVLAILGSLIGAVSFSGSVIAWAKLDGRLDKRFSFSGQQFVNLIVFLACLGLGAWLVFKLDVSLIIVFFVLALVFGVLMTLPIGGADMPVVISLYNAFTGLAVAFKGYVLQSESLIIAGTVVGAAGLLLTQLMAKAMNRPISNVLFSNFGGSSGEAQAITGSQKPIEASDVAAMMAYAERVVIVPGYGLAVAQAQHKVWELTQQLIKRDVKVKFAIHPVAGRMPGHMNVLLAEAGVPYDKIFDLEEINGDFAQADVALVIGANDVVNPSARTDKSSPIYGMPILNADMAQNVIVVKRGKGTGYSGIENALFYKDNTRLLYGSAQQAIGEVIQHVKALSV